MKTILFLFIVLRIFSTILMWYFTTQGFNEEVKKLENRIFQAT